MKRSPLTSGPIRHGDLPRSCREIADIIGLDAFLRLVRLRGGQELYLPKASSLERSARNRRIRAQAKTRSPQELAAQFHLSQRQVRKILQGGPQ